MNKNYKNKIVLHKFLERGKKGGEIYFSIFKFCYNSPHHAEI